MLWSFVYLGVRSLFALVWLLARSPRAKELKILVLRHELTILRRQVGRPKLRRADRALFAALSRSLPRPAWMSFPVKPETLLGWHRQSCCSTLVVSAQDAGPAATQALAARPDCSARA